MGLVSDRSLIAWFPGYCAFSGKLFVQVNKICCQSYKAFFSFIFILYDIFLLCIESLCSTDKCFFRCFHLGCAQFSSLLLINTKQASYKNKGALSLVIPTAEHGLPYTSSCFGSVYLCLTITFQTCTKAHSLASDTAACDLADCCLVWCEDMWRYHRCGGTTKEMKGAVLLSYVWALSLVVWADVYQTAGLLWSWGQTLMLVTLSHSWIFQNTV